MMRHQPKIVYEEKVVYEEVPFSEEAFADWVERYNPRKLNYTQTDLEECQKSLSYLRDEQLVNLANETKTLRAENKKLKRRSIMSYIFGWILPILALLGVGAYFFIKKRLAEGYQPPVK